MMKIAYASRSLMVLGLLAASLLGCGYALVGKGSNIPEDIKRVYVEPLANATQRLEVEQILTQAILDELVTRRRFDLVRGPSEADAILKGTVTNFRVTPVTFDNEGRAQEYEISIVADMSFRRVGDREPIWAADRYQFRQNYEAEGSSGDFFDQETLAIELTSVEFAATMVSDLLEGF